MFSDLRLEVIVRFVDIGGIVDHHCLNFLFIIIGHWTSVQFVLHRTTVQFNMGAYGICLTWEPMGYV